MFQITLPRALLLVTIALTHVTAARASVTQAEIHTYNAAVDVYNARLHRYERAAAEFNNEAVSYRHAVEHYNGLPGGQRTQFQRDRLDRWYNYLRQRLDALNTESDYLTRRGAEIDAWRKRIR